MSSDAVQLSDQFLTASAGKTDAEVHVSRGKQVVYVTDNNQGSYASGQVLIDATSQLNGSKGFASLREAYLTVPYVVTAKNTGTTTNSLRISRFGIALKNGVWNTISDIELELNGKQILTTNEYKQHWANLRAMTELSVSDLYKHGADMHLAPDDWYSINFSTTANGPGDGYANNQMDPTQNFDATLSQAQETLAYNTGFVQRLKYSSPMIIDKTTNAAFGWASLLSGAQTQIAQQHARSTFLEVPMAAAPGAITGTWIYMLKIRLIDLHPIFKELDLCANPQIKLKLRFNQGQVDINGEAANMSLAASTLTSGNTCPIMVASANTNCTMNGIMSTGSKLSFAFGVLQNGFSPTSAIAEYIPYTTTRLHIPFYDLTDARSIVSRPVKTVRYLDCFAQYFKQRAGLGMTNGQQNAAFNFQLSASLKNVKYIAVIPYAETSSGHWVSAHGTEQFASPFDSAPWTCQPGASIRNFQVQLGNQNVFAKTGEYDFEGFMDCFAKLSAINGDVDRSLNTGIINYDQWAWCQRIMVADCSRISEKDVPASIQVSGVNSCSQGSNYLILAVYERELDLDRLTGEVQRAD